MQALLITATHNTPERPSAQLASVLLTWLLLLILTAVGAAMWRDQHIDDVLRVILAFIGIGGALASFPIFAVLGQLAQLIFHTIADAFGWKAVGQQNNTFFILSILVGAWGVYLYYDKGTPRNLFWMILLLMPLYGSQTVRDAVNWYALHIGVHGWNAFVQAFNVLQKTPIHLSTTT